MSNAPIPPTPPKKNEGAASDQESSSSALRLDFKRANVEIDDKLTIEVEIAAYAELQKAAAAISAAVNRAIGKEGDANLFLLDSTLRSALDLPGTVELQLKNLREAFQGAASTAEEGAKLLAATTVRPLARTRTFSHMESFNAAASAADAAVALVNALRPDTRFFGRQVTIPEPAFALMLARQWQSNSSDVTFHYPTLFVPAAEATDDVMTDLINSLDAVVEERKNSSVAISSLLTRVSQMKPDDPQFAPARAQLESARDQFQAADAVFESVSSRLSKADERSGLTQLELLRRAYFVRSVAQQSPDRTYYLFAQVVSAGGAFRIERNFLRTLFWSPAISHSGGCIVTFGLFSSRGRLLCSDLVGSRSDYRDSEPRISLAAPTSSVSSQGPSPPQSPQADERSQGEAGNAAGAHSAQ